MNITYLFFWFLFIFSFNANATTHTKDLQWVVALERAGVQNFVVCGSEKINSTKKSLSQEFLIGPDQTGFVLSNIFTLEEYWHVLESKKLEEAKAELESLFDKVHLWKFTKEKGVQDLGNPSKVEMPFTATIRDCMEGSPTTLGNSCTSVGEKAKRSCCGEKFVGPNIFWGAPAVYELLYSPDPSTRIKIQGEKKHRYCLASHILQTSKILATKGE